MLTRYIYIDDKYMSMISVTKHSNSHKNHILLGMAIIWCADPSWVNIKATQQVKIIIFILVSMMHEIVILTVTMQLCQCGRFIVIVILAEIYWATCI